MLDRQRLLHHHRDVPRGRRFDDHRVIERAGERRDRLAAVVFSSIVVEVGEEDAVGQAVLLRVLLLERGVRLEDADDLHVLARLRRTQESRDVAVHEPGDRQARRRRGSNLLRAHRIHDQDAKDRREPNGSLSHKRIACRRVRESEHRHTLPDPRGNFQLIFL